MLKIDLATNDDDARMTGQGKFAAQKLREIADSLEAGQEGDWTVRDSNGNTCGAIEFRPEADYDEDEDEFDMDMDDEEFDEPDQFMHDGEADADALASAGFGTDEDYGGGCEYL